VDLLGRAGSDLLTRSKKGGWKHERCIALLLARSALCSRSPPARARPRRRRQTKRKNPGADRRTPE
jgi:hypothetical protein